MKNGSILWLLAALLFTGGCGGTASSGRDPSGGGANSGEHSHDGTTHTHADEAASSSVTVWTEDLELFMEYPTLSVGTTARFTVHLTNLKSFQPVAEGPVLFRFTQAERPAKMVTVGIPEVPGIFGPTVTFDEPGEYRMSVEIMSEFLEASLEYGPIEVHEAGDRAPEGGEPAGGQFISYLKEQQWKLPFASETVGPRRIQPGFQVPARIRAKVGTESTVIAAVAGMYAKPERGTPGLGSYVRAGDLLGYLELLPADRSGLLDGRVSAGLSLSRLTQDLTQSEALAQAEQARLELAEKEARRVRSLVEAEALPTKRLDEVESELKVRRTAVEAARQATTTYRNAIARFEALGNSIDAIEERISLTAPVGGMIVESGAVPGGYVDARQLLFRIVDSSKVWVEGQVFENDLRGLEGFQGAVLELPELEGIELDRGALVLVGAQIDPVSRTLPVILEVDNRDRRIKIGAIGKLQLQTAATVAGLAAPASAVLLEENRSVVYVQLEGETFERRIVTTGIRDRQWVEILGGIDAGERVVSVGAYDVALAGRSTEIADHGHVH